MSDLPTEEPTRPSSLRERIEALIHERTFAETLARMFDGEMFPQWVAMDDLRAALRETDDIASVLPTKETLAETIERLSVEHGIDELHSWRCGYPDVYGPCHCRQSFVDELAAAVLRLIKGEN